MVARCPRPDCPDPTLHVAKAGSAYHCIGCWRRFTPGVRNLPRAARQVPPAKRWLRAYSPGRLNGPPPALVQAGLTVRLRLRPTAPRPPSIAEDTSIHFTEDSPSWTSSSSSVVDDEVVSTAGYPGSTADANELLSHGGDVGPSWKSGALSSPDLLGIDFPEVYHSLRRYVARDEECESTGSTPDELIPVGSTTLRVLNLTHFGRKFVVCCGGAPVLT